MENNLENMVEIGTEVADEAANSSMTGKVVKYVITGAAAAVVVFVGVKCIVIPVVHKIKEKYGKKKDILDLEEFEG